MASEEHQRNPLPFEPTKKRSKSAKNSAKSPDTEQKPDKQPKPKKAENKLPEIAKKSNKPANKSPEPGKKSAQAGKLTTKEMAIPKVVSDRMARRMALFCGIPTFLGMATFVVSYIVKTNDWFKLPNVVVLLVSIGFFGLGVIGLSYGLLSTSWDEERVGSKLGWQELGINWGRMVSAWRSNKQSRNYE
ncbi:MAG: PAM68 family protein [Gloeocapsa sp. UFS-A4-WI-NPMV-4B04]|jgi:hypothetical protein|nr:PAM68 family protein [Gloeocapsa sp. UFS-A4-WI-NPMV-4B04]